MAFGSAYSPGARDEEEQIKRSSSQRPQQSLQTLTLQMPEAFDPMNISAALTGGRGRLSSLTGVDEGDDPNRMSALINALANRRRSGGSAMRPFGGMTTRPPSAPAPPRFVSGGGQGALQTPAAPKPPSLPKPSLPSGHDPEEAAAAAAAAAERERRRRQQQQQQQQQPQAPPIQPEIIGGGALEPPANTAPQQPNTPLPSYGSGASTGGLTREEQMQAQQGGTNTVTGTGSYYDPKKNMWITPGFTRGY